MVNNFVFIIRQTKKILPSSQTAAFDFIESGKFTEAI